METKHFEEQLTDAPAALRVVNEIGSITIAPNNDHGDGRAIHINAESRGMIVTVSNHDNLVIVRAEREEAWRNPIEQVKALFAQEHPEAHLTIQVPVDCAVNAKMVTGSLAVRGIDGRVNGRVVTGSAQLTDLGGPISVKTVTGNLTYHGQLSNDSHHFKTVTGAVRLDLPHLPHLPDTRLDARTDVGGIQCDFSKGTAVTTQNFVGSRLQKTLGNGQGHIKIRVVTGSIHLNHSIKEEKKTKSLNVQNIIKKHSFFLCVLCVSAVNLFFRGELIS